MNTLLDFPIYLDNIIFSLQKAGGISVYWSELLCRFPYSSKNIVIFEHGAAKDNIFRKKLPDDIPLNKERSLLPLQAIRYLPIQAKLEGPALFHSSYYRISNQRDVANIVTVHDFTYERFRHGLPKLVHSWQKETALRKADGIICVSQHTKKDLLFFHPWVKNKHIQVIHLGVQKDFKVITNKSLIAKETKRATADKYIVFVGDRSGYKNFNVAVETISQLPSYKLFLVGGGNLTDTETQNLNNRLPGRFRHFQGLDDNALNILYNRAFCLLYPSDYEGFGLPIVEAMNSGCPVVAIATSSIPEVIGQAGLLVDKPTPYLIIEKINMLEDAAFRDELISRGLEQAHKFSWDRCHRETTEFYQTVFHDKFG